MTMAPCSPLMFKYVDFDIGNWNINQYNCIGLFLAACSYILFVEFYFGLSNLTLDPAYDLVKDDILADSDKKPAVDCEENGAKLLKTKDLLKDFDILLLLTAEGMVAYQYFQLELLINMTALYHFHWSITKIAAVTAVCVLVTSVCLYFGQKPLMNGTRNVYFLYISCFVFLIILESALNLAIPLNIKNKTIQIVIIWFILFLNILQGFGSTVYCVYLLFALTPAHSASIVESHRYVVSKVFSCVAYFTSSFVFNAIFPCLTLYSVICCIIIILLLVRKSSIIAGSKYEKINDAIC